jgi:small GTP-binding protein
MPKLKLKSFKGAIVGLQQSGKTTLRLRLTEEDYQILLPPTVRTTASSILVVEGSNTTHCPACGWKSEVTCPKCETTIIDSHICPNCRMTIIDLPKEICPNCQTALQGLAMDLYDTPGQKTSRERALLQALHNVDVVICVIDGTVPERFEETAEFLAKILETIPEKVPLAILYNKKDLAEYYVDPEAEAEQVLKPLRQVFFENKRRLMRVFPTSVLTGEGMAEALEWIYHHIPEAKKYWEHLQNYLKKQEQLSK